MKTIAALILAAIAATAAGQSGRSKPRDEARAQRRSTATRSARSGAPRRQFQRLHPCPATGKPSGACPGYVVDHVVALKHGGSDEPANMQWQTIAEAKAKDRIE